MTFSNKPDYLLIGGQKCATSWLYRCLREHPGIFVPPQKRDSVPLGHPKYEEEGYAAYFEPFKEADQDQVIADASVSYLYTQESPRVINTQMPECRFIVMLRNPIDRAISAFFWAHRNNTIDDHSAQDALKRELAGEGKDTQLLNKGLFYHHLQPYFQQFDQGKFLFITFGAVENEPLQVLKRVFRYLKADADFQPKSMNTKPKKNAKSTVISSLENRTKQIIPQRGKIKKLTNSFFYQLNERLGSDQASAQEYLDTDTQKQLKAYFNPDTQALIDFLEDAPDNQVIGKAYLKELKP